MDLHENLLTQTEYKHKELKQKNQIYRQNNINYVIYKGASIMSIILKKVIGLTIILYVLLSSVSVFAMSTSDFDAGMDRGIDYFNRGLYYEARDEFQWFCDYNWSKMNIGQQKYALDYLDGTKQKINEWNKKYALSAYNGYYRGGGKPYNDNYTNAICYIGEWYVRISNTTTNSLTFSIAQSESDYFVSDIILTRQSNGSYKGNCNSSWGMSYFTVWLESANCISVTVSGNADSTGTEKLYKY